MAKRNGTKIATVISSILLLVLFVGMLTFLLKETDNLTTNPGALYVEVDGERISSNKDYFLNVKNFLRNGDPISNQRIY